MWLFVRNILSLILWGIPKKITSAHKNGQYFNILIWKCTCVHACHAWVCAHILLIAPCKNLGALNLSSWCKRLTGTRNVGFTELSRTCTGWPKIIHSRLDPGPQISTFHILPDCKQRTRMLPTHSKGWHSYCLTGCDLFVSPRQCRKRRRMQIWWQSLTSSEIYLFFKTEFGFKFQDLGEGNAFYYYYYLNLGHRKACSK